MIEGLRALEDGLWGRDDDIGEGSAIIVPGPWVYDREVLWKDYDGGAKTGATKRRPLRGWL